MSERTQASTSDLHQFVTTGGPYAESLDGLLNKVLASQAAANGATGFMPETNSIAPFRELIAEAITNNRFVEVIHDALNDYTYHGIPMGEGATTSLPAADIDARLIEAGLGHVDGRDYDLQTDLISSMTDSQINDYVALINSGVPPFQAELLVRSTDPQAQQFIQGATLADLNYRIENWSGSENDPIFDQLVRDRNAIIEDFTGTPYTGEHDPNITAIAIQNNITYEQADFAVTTTSIDQLTQEIRGWEGHPNDGRLTELSEAGPSTLSA